MVEGQTQNMELNDIEGDTFGLFVHWLYTQEAEHANEGQMKTLALVKLWNLGQRFIIPQLQNKAMSLLLRNKKLHLEMGPVCRLAFGAIGPTPIQRYIINCLVSCSFSEFNKENKELLGATLMNCFMVGKDMAKEFVTALVEKRLIGGVAKLPSIDDLADYLVSE
jgi:hypothetical protein